MCGFVLFLFQVGESTHVLCELAARYLSFIAQKDAENECDKSLQVLKVNKTQTCVQWEYYLDTKTCYSHKSSWICLRN